MANNNEVSCCLGDFEVSLSLAVDLDFIRVVGVVCSLSSLLIWKLPCQSHILPTCYRLAIELVRW